jgi:oligosaccharyltransferase complex subunit gamma
MKFSLTPLAGLVSLLLAASAQASTQDDFLAEANAAPNGIIKLDSASYERLVSSSPGSPRNYSVTVVLTALPEQFKCQPCQ